MSATPWEISGLLSFLFKLRDKSVYPEDEFGDELYKTFPKADKLPLKANLWFDMYFEKETDAKAMVEEFSNRRYEINEDYDEEPDEDFGKWNIDVEYPIKPSYREIRANVEQMRDRVNSRGGKLASWLLMPGE